MIRRNKSRFSGVLFDLDDTLYREMDFVRSGFHAVSAHLSSNGFGEPGEIFRELMNLHHDDPTQVFDRWISTMKGNLSIAELVAIYREHQPRLRLIPGVQHIVKRLREQGVPLGIVTDGIPSVQFNKVQALGLEEYVEHVVYTRSEEVGLPKPHPAGLLHAVRKLGVRAGHAVYVGDNGAKDATAACAAGMSFVWARYAKGYYHHLGPTDREHVGYVATTVQDLFGILLP